MFIFCALSAGESSPLRIKPGIPWPAHASPPRILDPAQDPAQDPEAGACQPAQDPAQERAPTRFPLRIELRIQLRIQAGALPAAAIDCLAGTNEICERGFLLQRWQDMVPPASRVKTSARPPGLRGSPGSGAGSCRCRARLAGDAGPVPVAAPSPWPLAGRAPLTGAVSFEVSF